MKWEVGASRSVYSSHWLELELVDVTLPDGRSFPHEVARSPRDGAATVVVRDHHVLMILRHRFIADVWAWELPGGMVEAGEDVAQAAAREVTEETGWRPAALTPLTTMHPSSGWSDQRLHLFYAQGAEHIGPPTEANEAAEVAWRSFDEVRNDLAAGAMPDGLTQLGLAFAIARDLGVDLTGKSGWSNRGASGPT